MGLTPTTQTVIGQYVNSRRATFDFLQLADSQGGHVFGWIDSDGHLQGSLLSSVSPVTSVFGRTGDIIAASGDYSVSQVTGAAAINSQAFTGTPSLPSGTTGVTQPLGTANTTLATTSFAINAAGGIGVNAVYAAAFGAKFDGQVRAGNISTIVTNGTTTVTCDTGNFTAADIGKQFTATNGCCGVQHNYSGVSLLASPSTATTIVAVNSSMSITVSQNVSACSGTSCMIAWATNDDAALTAAETAWQSFGRCGALILPAGTTAVLQPHFTNPGAECLSFGAQDDYTAQVSGTGLGTTVVGIFPGFNFAGCPSTGCFGGYLEQSWQNWQINGFGWGNTGAPANTILIGTGLGSQLEQFGCNATGGSDTNLTGMKSNEGTRVWGLSIDGCGNTGWEIAGSIVKSYYSFVGDNLGPAISIDVNSDLTDFGGDYGVQGGTIVIELNNGARYHGVGSNLFGNPATNGTAIYLPGTNSTVILDGCRFNNTAVTSNGIFSGSVTNKVILASGTIVGGTSASIGGSSKLFMDNTVTLLTNGSPTKAALTGTGACLTSSLTAQNGGLFAGSVNCGNTTGASTLIITPGTTAPNGWICTAADVTTANTLTQTASSTTACTISGTVNANDVINFVIQPF